MELGIILGLFGILLVIRWCNRIILSQEADRYERDGNHGS